jgi:hypothetical protein
MREYKVPLELESKESLVNKALPARGRKVRLVPVLKVQLVLERRGQVVIKERPVWVLKEPKVSRAEPDHREPLVHKELPAPEHRAPLGRKVRQVQDHKGQPVPRARLVAVHKGVLVLKEVPEFKERPDQALRVLLEQVPKVQQVPRVRLVLKVELEPKGLPGVKGQPEPVRKDRQVIREPKEYKVIQLLCRVPKAQLVAKVGPVLKVRLVLPLKVLLVRKVLRVLREQLELLLRALQDPRAALARKEAQAARVVLVLKEEPEHKEQEVRKVQLVAKVLLVLKAVQELKELKVLVLKAHPLQLRQLLLAMPNLLPKLGLVLLKADVLGLLPVLPNG